MRLATLAQTVIEAQREGRAEALFDGLYAPGVVSVEALPGPHGGRETHGLDFLRAKHAWWHERHALRGVEVGGPFLHGSDRFGVTYALEVESRATGARRLRREIAVYTVAGGRVVREEFFRAA